MRRIGVRSKLYIIPLVLIFGVVILIFYERYKDTKDIIRAEYNSKIELVEQSIYDETKYTETIRKITEGDLREKMEENSKFLVGEYRKNNNIFTWDFQQLKSEVDGMDIYIMDEDLTVIASSLEEEVGLNFSKYGEFSDVLTDRLNGDKFKSDTINFSRLKGELKKYGYIPTPDNRYLIETSVNIENVYPELKNLNLVYLVEDLKDKYPFVKDIGVYKFNRNKEYSHSLDTYGRGDSEGIIQEAIKDNYVKESLETNSSIDQVITNENKEKYRLKYIPYTAYYDNNEITWWESYVIGILYDDSMLVGDLSDQKKIFVENIVILSILYFTCVFSVIYAVRKSREIAYEDHLTKLPNRKRFEEEMHHRIYEADRKNERVAVFFFDVDKFKSINDSFGHDIGDKVLQRISSNLKRHFRRKTDMIARLGGDEFIGMVYNPKTDDEVLEHAERIASEFGRQIDIDSKNIYIKLSIGISIYPVHGIVAEELIQKADYSMYRAKNSQLNCELYSENIK